MEDWKKKRMLAPLEIASIKSILGNDVTMALSKKQIAEMSQSDYKTVAANVKLHLDKIGITWDAWKCCNLFPPNVSRRILDALG